MTAPFYLHCECGGQLKLFDDWICGSCSEKINPGAMEARYAKALGVAMEALEELLSRCDEGEPHDGWVKVACEKALAKIKLTAGEGKP